LCVELSEKLIDDIPVHDPRWAENSVKSGKSLNSNLIISNQLTKKLQLHEYFLKFLKAFNIWQNVNIFVFQNYFELYSPFTFLSSTQLFTIIGKY
jgi:hypothetical protein